MKIGLNAFTHRLAPALIGVLLLAPGLAAAQSTLDMTINATYDQDLASDVFNFYAYSAIPPFSETTQASAVFAPETILVAVPSYAYEGMRSQSAAAVQSVVIPDAQAAAFNDLLANWVNPNITVAQIEPHLSGTSTFTVTNLEYPVPYDQLLAQASVYVSAVTGSPFYDDGTNSYWAWYVADFEGSLVLGTDPSFTSFDQFTFSQADAVQWMNQMSFSATAQLDIIRCPDAWVCDNETLNAYADQTYLDLYGNASIAVTAVPEADASMLWLAGLGLVGFAAARRRRTQ